jgi:hypothetical protein
MKNITTFAIIAAAIAALGTGAARADDQQLQNRLALQRAQVERNQRTTIAVYAGRHGVGQRQTALPQRAETRFELRTNAHGQQFGVFVPVK